MNQTSNPNPSTDLITRILPLINSEENMTLMLRFWQQIRRKPCLASMGQDENSQQSAHQCIPNLQYHLNMFSGCHPSDDSVSSAINEIIEQVAFSCLFNNLRMKSLDQVLAFFWNLVTSRPGCANYTGLIDVKWWTPTKYLPLQSKHEIQNASLACMYHKFHSNIRLQRRRD